jgi:hypothetical protein
MINVFQAALGDAELVAVREVFASSLGRVTGQLAQTAGHLADSAGLQQDPHR